MKRVYLSLLATLSLVSCNPLDPLDADFSHRERARLYQADVLKPAPVTLPATLLVMNWNVKFGGGRIDFFFDCHGNRTNMAKSEVITNLEGLAEKINQVDPDLLVLQEVDVESKRSAYVDELAWLLEHTQMNYAAYASQWHVDYVPADGIGRVDTGNAVLSRWPITEATRIALPVIASDDAITNYFYLKRNILSTRVALPGLELAVLGVHAEAYSFDGTKKKHIDRFKQELDDIAAEGALFVASGDLNALPPGTVQVKDFPDSVCGVTDPRFDSDDYSGEETWLDELYATYEPEVPRAVYQSNNTPWFGFTSDKDGFWNRKLDYVWTNGDFVDGSALVHQDAAAGGLETMSRSDHAPLTVRLVP